MRYRGVTQQTIKLFLLPFKLEVNRKKHNILYFSQSGTNIVANSYEHYVQTENVLFNHPKFRVRLVKFLCLKILEINKKA